MFSILALAINKKIVEDETSFLNISDNLWHNSSNLNDYST